MLIRKNDWRPSSVYAAVYLYIKIEGNRSFFAVLLCDTDSCVVKQGKNCYHVQ